MIANATRRSERLEVTAGPRVNSIVFWRLASRLSGDALRTVWDAIALYTTPGIPEHKVPEVALVTAGVEYDVLAEKLLGYVRPKFCAIIRGSKHST